MQPVLKLSERSHLRRQGKSTLTKIQKAVSSSNSPSLKHDRPIVLSPGESMLHKIVTCEDNEIMYDTSDGSPIRQPVQQDGTPYKMGLKLKTKQVTVSSKGITPVLKVYAS